MTMSTTPVGAIVLAAGASVRMGESKALLRWRGRAFVTHVVEGARGAGCSPIVVVQGAFVLPAELVAGAVLVDNPSWQAGQLSSLQCGIRSLAGAQLSGALVLTVDRPHVQSATLRALVEAHRTEPQAIWQPDFEGQRGHPIVFPMDVLHEIAELPLEASPRSVLRRFDVAARRRSISVLDRAVLDNLDRPEDLGRLP
mgnify:CR=1 FL=1